MERGVSMRAKESKKLRTILEQYEISKLSPMLEIGSSTLEFRTKTKPHINRNIHEPFKGRGGIIITSDLKEGEGIEISGDLYDQEIQAKIRAHRPKSILCANILEHVVDPKEFLKICDNLIGPGGFLIITVPYSYPYHADPIDTMFRPSPEEIGSLVEGYNVISAEIHKDTTYWYDLFGDGLFKGVFELFVKWPARILIPNKGLTSWSRRLQWLIWLFRRYQITMIVLCKQ